MRDLHDSGSTTRLKAWALAIAVAIAGVQSLHAAGLIDITGSLYLGQSFGWGGALAGGLIFGAGMALAGSCGFSLIIRAGAGDLKAVMASLVMGLSAYMAARGLTGLARVSWLEPLSMPVEQDGGQAMPALIGAAVGVDPAVLWLP